MLLYTDRVLHFHLKLKAYFSYQYANMDSFDKSYNIFPVTICFFTITMTSQIESWITCNRFQNTRTSQKESRILCWRLLSPDYPTFKMCKTPIPEDLKNDQRTKNVKKLPEKIISTVLLHYVTWSYGCIFSVFWFLFIRSSVFGPMYLPQ